MAEKIQVWAIKGTAGQVVAAPLEELRSTETEQRLEELLVASPELLMPDLTLVGRQLPTAGGPLDLLGIDQEGRLVLIELKRGTLTRDAVAQIIDYGSELQERQPEQLSHLIEQYSGRLGIEKIEDFADWYRSEFPDVDDPPPVGLRLVLVGLGADDRARRMVNFLVKSGLEIQLLTFQAFKDGEGTFLARHMEIKQTGESEKRAVGGTKEGNQKILEELADRAGVHELFLEVGDFVESKLTGYRWPGKSGYTYSLQEMTDKGKPTLRAYAWLGVGAPSTRKILLQLPARAIDVAPTAIETASGWNEVRRSVSRWVPFELTITPENWPILKGQVSPLLDAIVQGWKTKLELQKKNESTNGNDVLP